MSECGIAGQVAKQDFSCRFVIAAGKAQPQQETAEGIFLVIGLHNLGGDALLISCHLAQPVNE